MRFFTRLASVFSVLGASFFTAQAQQSPHAGLPVASRLIVIGDAGALVNGKSPVINAARKTIPFDEKTNVLFIGDNLYRYGLPDEQEINYTKYRAVLDSQIAIINQTKAHAYFIPGNHDWKNGAPDGLQALIRQQNYINSHSGQNVHFIPNDGCPGPEVVNLGKNAVLVIMDSQWWLHGYEKPELESDCNTKSRTEILEELKDIVNENDRKLLLFATHHPFRSNGEHGGYYPIKSHIFPLTDISPNLYVPLPVIGSIYPITRSVFGTIQDLKHPTYANMVEEVEAVVRKHPHPVFLAGHEHNLQYFKDSSTAFVVSGSGCKRDRVSRSRASSYVDDKLGFAVITIYENKTSDLNFYTVSRDGETIENSFRDSMLSNFQRLPDLAIPDTAISYSTARFQDSIRVPASMIYANPGKLKTFVMGTNYRKEWETPVKMRIFKINSEKGGLKITGKGGGMQTKSLRLEDKNGKEYTLRTIDKDPESVLPEGLKATFAKDLVQDIISSSHPYGALTVPVLAKAAGVIAAKPEVVFVPNDPALGYYRTMFANQVCLLEEREPVAADIRTRSSAKTFNKLIEENDNLVDQKAVLRARLLDIFIGDWDRHFDQWRFAQFDTGKGKLYEPIPRDRDQVFFDNDGMLIRLVTRQHMQQFSGFKSKMKNTKFLGFNARHFDRIFLNDLSADDWKMALQQFDSAMSDEVLQKAVKQLPPEIYPISGPEILAKLRSRKKQMMDEGMKYQRFLAQYVNVLGSQNKEVFEVTNQGDTAVRIKVSELKKKSTDTHFVMYDRTVDPWVTEEVRLYGFQNDDKFIIDSGLASRKMKIRMIGGKGNDTFLAQGNIRNFIYDFKGEDNQVLASHRSELRISSNPAINNFDMNETEFDKTIFPSVTAGYNGEDGVLLGIGLQSVKYGFRKDPYQRLHKLSLLSAIGQKALRFNYSGTFIDLVKYNDFVVNATMHNPTLDNFYGLGNDTRLAEGQDQTYYRVRYNFASADVLLRHRMFNNVLSLSVGPTAYHYWNNPEDNEGKVLENPAAVGLNSSVFDRKTYVGGKAVIDINNIGNTLFPTRGVDWVTTFSSMAGVSGEAKSITRLTSEMNVYAALSDPARLVAVMRLGGGKILSNNYEYFQALGIGQNNYLRGFRRNRFSGQSMAYGSLELRAKLFDVNSYFLPGAFGVVGFGDAARVWVRDDQSAKWHFAPGAGFYYTPFNLLLISGTVAFTDEQQTLINITVGTRFNLTF